jgi:hypothetical protein
MILAFRGDENLRGNIFSLKQAIFFESLGNFPQLSDILL